MNETAKLWSYAPVAAVAVFLSSGCGQAEVSGLDASVVDPGRSCLDVCRSAANQLRDDFGVAAPCAESEWAMRASDCQVCGALFEKYYGLTYEWDLCRDCRDDARPAPACGVPPPVCGFGTRPELADCDGPSCGECSPLYTGACEPCPQDPG